MSNSHTAKRHKDIANSPMSKREIELFHQLGAAEPELLLSRLATIARVDEDCIERLKPHVLAINDAFNALTASILERNVDIDNPNLTFGNFSARVASSHTKFADYLSRWVPEIQAEDIPPLERLYNKLTARLEATLANSVRNRLGTDQKIR